MKTKHLPALILSVFFSFLPKTGAQTMVIHIDAGKVAAQVSPTLYGLMTEEINYSYDGGLYGELIRNRVFEGSEYHRARGQTTPVTFDDTARMAHWTVARYNGGAGAISIDTAQPLNGKLGYALKLDATFLKAGQRVGVANDGYWGIPVRPGTTYRASFYAKADANFEGGLTAAIETSDGATVFATADVPRISGDWKQYTVTLKTGELKESTENRFVISTGARGTILFNLVSLFPPTFNDRPNGNRIDLMQKLVDMKPAFLRFPGGNYVEGDDLENYFNWKKTIGPLAERPTHLSPWSYRSSDGMGLLEFLEWTEDMRAQPVLAVFGGLTLSGTYAATGNDLKPHVQDALDEIEYVTGDKSTKWGAQRIADGHPEPFQLNFVEVGNEDFLPRGANSGIRTYEERFAAFFDAIRAKYPQIKIIATTPVKSRVADFLDEHYYFRTAEEAEIAAHKYDKRERGPTKVFCGEWATRVGSPTTNLKAALADAAFMTGMERNSDLVQICCYAPLFVNVNKGGMQWPSDLIGYNAMTSYGSPSYYAQKMFSNYLGYVVLPTTMDNVPTALVTMRRPTPRNASVQSSQPPAPQIQLEQLYCVVTKDSKNGAIFTKVVNISGSPLDARIDLKGAGSVAADGQSIVLTSESLADTNTIDAPEKVLPVVSKMPGVSANFMHTFPPFSVTVLQIDTH
ncbi:MAG: carbohydrate binding domain-containing protein [Planctomycetota bacterium]|nr:carbohydrate binding domain-containing protein [Planctomycetota bacterium]